MEALAGQTHLVKAKCNGFQTSLQSGNAAETGSQHPSLQNLRELLDAHAELLARLTSEPPATSSDDVRELLAVSQARERCLGEGLAALGSVALSMRAVLDDVEELMPADSGYLPNVQVQQTAACHGRRHHTLIIHTACLVPCATPPRAPPSLLCAAPLSRPETRNPPTPSSAASQRAMSSLPAPLPCPQFLPPYALPPCP